MYNSIYMKLEFVILGLTIFFIYNAYHDGKYLKMIFYYKKYFHMGFLALLGFSLYLLIKRNPLQTKQILLNANNMVKYMPIDKSSIDMISPIIDFTTGAQSSSIPLSNQDFSFNGGAPIDRRILNSGSKGTKRSVSETKKKYVASMQNWKCGNCKQQLNHTFEIDHKVRLEYDGSNNVDNLVALCRNCHGEKTAMENM
jgi:hypothetical protein